MSTATVNPLELLKGLPISACEFRPPDEDAGTLSSVNPATGKTLFQFRRTSPKQAARMCAYAGAAFEHSLATGVTGECRAQLLDLIARKLDEARPALVAMYNLECALPVTPRANGELDRTIGQLRAFAAYLRQGEWCRPTLSFSADGKLSIRKMLQATGPQAIWAPSNFPFAFSVAGGDTAAAFAAGCPVVFKAHKSHPGTSELVGGCIAAAILEVSAIFHPGWFSLVQSDDRTLGAALIEDEHIASGALTGSQAAGILLSALAFELGKSFFAEMSAVNPVFVLPGKLAENPAGFAEGYVGSLTLGLGQFCTNPGVLFIVKGPDYDAFLAKMQALIAAKGPGTMLNREICAAYLQGVAERRKGDHGCTVLAESTQAAGLNQSLPIVFGTTGEYFFEQFGTLSHEIFGHAGLVVVVENVEELLSIASLFTGELTGTIWGTKEELAGTQGLELRSKVARIAGRVIANDWPTGVVVCAAQNHGGPYAACTRDVTSVGLDAIERFLRPVAFQGADHQALPWQLRDENPNRITRRLQVAPAPGVFIVTPPEYTTMSVPEFIALKAK